MSEESDKSVEPLSVMERRAFGDDAERCERTGRIFERGSGALSKEAQTAMFVREAAIAGDMPKEGERCPETDRLYEVGSGCFTKQRQTHAFLQERDGRHV